MTEKEKAAFETRTVMAMADEMRAAKEALDRSCILFTALARSIGVEVEFKDAGG